MTNTLSNNACREVLHCESTLGPRWPQDWELGIKSIQILFLYFPESALGALEAGRVVVAKGGDQPLSWKHLMSWWSSLKQGGRTWQPFVGGKNGHENFRQARMYNFCNKCVVFARNRKFAKLTRWNMQYIPCNSALLAQETLFLTQKGTFFA